MGKEIPSFNVFYLKFFYLNPFYWFQNYVPVEEEAEGIIQANILCQSARSMIRVYRGVKQTEEPVEPQADDERPKEFDSFIPLAEPTTSIRTAAEEEILADRLHFSDSLLINCD